MGFIEEIAKYVQKYSKIYNIKVNSPIIAQAILESDKGKSELAKNANNYFGIKYRPNRCPSSNGTYIKVGSEQDSNGKYTSSVMTWCKFPDMESCVKGYFEFISISRYDNLKTATDYETYLRLIKADGYATSNKYVENLINVIKTYNLTKYDEVKTMNIDGVELKTNLADKSNYGSLRGAIKYIVIHYTGNDGDTDENNGKYFNGKNRNASAHYFVDDDSITQSVPDNYTAWHCGTKGKYYHSECRNANSIGIEMCDTEKNGVYNLSTKTRNNTIKLIKYLMNKYNIPISNVLRHYDITHKRCPSYFVDNQQDWLNFKKEIQGITLTNTNTNVTINTTVKVESAKSFSSAMKGSYIVNSNTGLNLRCGAGANKQKIGVLKDKEKVTCYGYYSTNGKTIWLLVSTSLGTGFCSLNYLIKQ